MLIDEKVAQAVEILKEFKTDCWLTFVRETALNGDPTLPYLVSGPLTWHSALIVSSSGRKIAIVGKYDQKSVEDLGVYDAVIGYVEGMKRHLQQALQELNPRSIAINYSTGSEICDGLTHGMYLTLHEYLTEVGMQERLVSSEPVVSALRQRKTPEELSRLREAIRHTLEIFSCVAAYIAPGRTEADLAAFMRERVSEKKLEFAWDPGTCPSVFTGPDTAAAHYGPTGRTVQKGHILNMDFGLKYEGYCSDLQRTFYILEDGEAAAPEDVAKGFAAIVRAIEQTRKMMKPGVIGREVDALARRILDSEGYQEFPHALGHQVGRFAHDGTALLGPMWEKYASKPLQPLEEKMVFTIEPRLTVPGRGVVTIEEMVVVQADGAEFLSVPQKELVLIR